jgi:hypothetical protein
MTVGILDVMTVAYVASPPKRGAGRVNATRLRVYLRFGRRILFIWRRSLLAS